MKTFAQFIKEAVETLASTEAKNRGLVGNGHGDWYDKQGNFIAKTVKGKLKFFGQGDTVSNDGIPGEEQKLSQKSNIETTPQQKNTDENEVENGVVIVLSRFNPPSKEHERILKAGFNQAKRKGYEYRIYPSRIEDGQTNPLNPSLKIQYLQLMFPDYADYIVDSDDMRTIFDVLGSAYNDGYGNVDVVVGQDRLGEFQNLIHKADGQQYQFNNIEVITSGSKDPDSEIESLGSSSMMRTAAAIKDFERFSAGLPISMKPKDKERFFNSVVKSMNVSEETELWKIFPEMDYENLRWNYKNNGLYEVGSLIENFNTGLVGKIIRRGANYLICVTEDNIMFKSWLNDVREVYEIGTTRYREYAQKHTPGQSVVSYSDDVVNETMPKKTININRKKYKVK